MDRDSTPELRIEEKAAVLKEALTRRGIELALIDLTLSSIYKNYS